jgi:predicted nuclease of restriction endonuclease-like (RecB) superfamily
LSTDKEAVLAKAQGTTSMLPADIIKNPKAQGTTSMLPADIIKNPYVLEFLGLAEKADYSENDLEQAIIDHLQEFLLEAGRGFCFEGRQKRITFGNTHYRIDLVFYHRILKCHVLVDLKLGEFTHADAGQMNVYLNYYQDQEMTEGDNPPIGIILCAQKDDALVKYATGGLPQPVFVSKYLVNLPSEEALRQLIREEQAKFST